jgi:hypothetical protein
MQPITNYDIESKKVLEAHQQALANFDQKYPALAKIAENNLTMLIPDVWNIMMNKLDTAPPHDRRDCPDTPARK